nr:ribonuclease H-like domain-containing protein [Tanacetum cinerariifolium]
MAVEDTSQPPPPPITSTKAPQMVSSVKIPILNKGEYILWTMKIEQYLAHTDYALWEVILNGPAVLTGLAALVDAAAFGLAALTCILPDLLNTAVGENLLDEALREKEDLKAKLKKFETSLKNLTKLLDSPINAKVKTGLGYDSQFNEKEVLDVKEEEVTKTVFDNRSSVEENCLANDRFKKGEGYHAVPPSLTGNYMPSKSDVSFAGLDDSIYKFKISETVTSLAKDKKDAPETSTAYVEKPKEDRSIFTRSGRIPVSAAKPKDAATTSTAKPVNTAGPTQTVNFSKSRSTFHKSHSPIRRSFYNATAHSKRNSTERVNNVGSKAVSAVKENEVTTVKTSAGCVWRPRVNEIDQLSKDNRWICTRVDYGHPQQALKNKGIVDSGCSKHMIGNKAYLTDYQEINDGGFVAFGSSKGKTTSKGKIKTEKLDFDDVYFVNELQFNLFSVSQMCDMKNSVLFTETECLVLSPDFKLLDESQVLIRIPRQSNMALVTKSHNKTPYELVIARTPILDFIRPFECPVTILNTLDPLGKFEGKANEGFLVGYYVTSKAFRVFNTKTRKVEENLHARFLENKPNVAGTGPNWLFDINSLTNSMNYIPVSAGNQTNKNTSPQDTNGNAGTQDNVDAKKEVSDQHYIMLPLWSSISSTFKSSDDKVADDKPKDDTGSHTVEEPINKEDQAYRDELDKLLSQEKEARCMDQRGTNKADRTNPVNTVSNPVNAASTLGTFSAGGPLSPHPDAFIPAVTLSCM